MAFNRSVTGSGPGFAPVVGMEAVSDVLAEFKAKLVRAGYFVEHEIAYAPDFGVPQRRSRLVLLASRHGPISLDRSTAECPVGTVDATANNPAQLYVTEVDSHHL